MTYNTPPHTTPVQPTKAHYLCHFPFACTSALSDFGQTRLSLASLSSSSAVSLLCYIYIAISFLTRILGMILYKRHNISLLTV